MATFTSEINVDIDEFLEELDHDEKKELFGILAEELGRDEEIEKLEHDIAANKRDLVLGNFRELSDFDKRKFLVDALYVPNYYDDDALKDALEPIMKAR